MELTGAIGYPLSPQQELAWQTLAGTSAGHASVLVRISGAIDAARLQRALLAVVERHEILRTAFVAQTGRRLPLQVIGPEAALQFGSHDLRGCDEPQQMREIEAIRRALLSGSSDTDSAAPLRAGLIALRDQKHLLLVVAPVMCVDAESLQVLVGHAAQAYAGTPFGDAPVQYADYSEWQRQELESAEAAAAAGRERWARATQAGDTDLPCFASAGKSDEDAFRTAVVEQVLERDLVEAVETLARSAGVAPERVYLAAWQLVVGRITGSERVAVGLTVPARISSDVLDACGAYAKTLPVAIDVNEDDTFAELLRRSASAASDAIAAETYWPCAVDTPRVQFEFFTRRSVAVADLLWTVERVEAHLAAFTAKLTCSASAQAFGLSLSYDARRVPEAAAARLLALYTAALAQVTRSAAVALKGVGLGSGDAQTRGTGVAPSWSTVPARFAELVAATPQAPAVTGEDATWTYAELDREASRIAGWLANAGVERGALVAVGGDRSAALLAAVIGIWKAGAGYVPVALDQPAPRVAAQLAETAARAVILTDARPEGALAGFAGPVLCLRDSDALASETTARPSVGIDPSDTAYVLYTSGSTGRPKGVRVEHRHLAAYTRGIVEALDAAGLGRQGMRFATVSALTADLGNTCIFPALATGGCVHMIPPAAILNADALGACIGGAGVDVLKITPSHLAALLSETASVLPRTLLICGGESLSWELVRDVRGRGTCAIWNHYGPTETTVGALFYPVPADEAAWPATRSVPVGTPIGRAAVSIVDASGQVVPRGVVGEIWIGGPSVAAEYVGQPALTADRFVSPAWSADGRQYRTGDRARMSLDGIVEFLGRTDDQVKIRGFRVEPGEVEHVLLTIPGVKEAAVVATGDPADLRLVAYVAGPGVTDGRLREALEGRLPQYMWPTLVQVPALPRLGNGKIDRRALAAAALPSDTGTAAVAPRTAVETAMAELWQKLLNRAPIGVHDNFFEIGGHSLLATRLVAQVRREFDVQLALRSIFEHPTIASLAAVVDERLTEAAGSLADLPESELQALLAELDADQTRHE